MRTGRTMAGGTVIETDAGDAGVWIVADGRELRWGSAGAQAALLSEAEAAVGETVHVYMSDGPTRGGLTERAAHLLAADGVPTPGGRAKRQHDREVEEVQAILDGRPGAERSAEADDARRRLARRKPDPATEAAADDARSRLRRPRPGEPARDDGDGMGDEAAAVHEQIYGGRRTGEPARAPERKPMPGRGAGRAPGGPISALPGTPPSLRRRRR